MTDRTYDEDRFAEMWVAGATTDQIATALNLSKTTVYDWRVRLKLEPRQVGKSKYPAAQLELLERLWCVEGLSASEIARRIGHGWTRNTVIGQVVRRGFDKAARQTPSAPAVKSLTPKPAPVKKARTTPTSQPVLGVPFPVVSPEVAAKARAAAASKGQKAADAFLIPANDGSIPLLSRRRFQCAWPVGNPIRPSEQLCCGQPVDPNGNKAVASYCGHHAGLAVARVLRGGAPDEKRYERAMRRWAA